MSITDKQYLLLSQFSYNDMTGYDDEGTPYDYRGKTVGEILDCMQIRSDINYKNALEDYNNNPSASPEDKPTKTKELDKLVDRYSEFNFATGSGNEFENIKNFKLVGFQNNSKDTTDRNGGFSGSAFESPTGETIFAFRGTEPKKDQVNDILLEDIGNLGIMGLVGGGGLTVNSQTYYARNFVFETLANKYPEDNIEINGSDTTTRTNLNAMIMDNHVSFTGHSLGGAIAAFMTYYTHDSNVSKAVTFNAPGMGQLIDEKNIRKYRVTDFADGLDVIGNALIQIGETTNIISDFLLKRKITEKELLEDYDTIFKNFMDFQEGMFDNTYFSAEEKESFLTSLRNRMYKNPESNYILIEFEENRIYDKKFYEDAFDNGIGILTTNATHPLTKFLNDFDENGNLSLNHVNKNILTKYMEYLNKELLNIMLDSVLPPNVQEEVELILTTLLGPDKMNEIEDFFGIENLADKVPVIEEFVNGYIDDLFTLIDKGIENVSEGIEDISEQILIYKGMIPRLVKELYFKYLEEKFGFDFNPNDSLEDVIKDLNDAMASRNQRVDPLTLDLDGDGIETTSVEKGVYFDLDKNNFAEKTGWVKSDDGLLTLDRNNDGKITNGGELFGDQTILKNGKVAKNGFEALSEFDTNKDGKIDNNDEVYKELKVWRDLNQDGISSGNELFSMEELEIKSINLGYKEVNILDEKNNILSRLSAYEKNDGTTHSIGELLLDRNTLTTKDLEYVKISEEILKLPDIDGLGNVSSLHKSMAKDKTGTLMLLVKSFMSEYDLEKRTVLFEQILLKWSDSDNVPKDSRGVSFDAGKLTALEKFLGVSYVGTAGSNPIEAATLGLSSAYSGLSEVLYVKLLLGTHLKDYVPLMLGLGSLDSLKNKIESDITLDYDKGLVLLNDLARVSKVCKLEDNKNYKELLDYFHSKNEDFAFAIDSSRFNGSAWALGKNILGSFENDTIVGTVQDDVINAKDGDDIIDSGAGNDVVYGGAGNDTINAGIGNDHVYGGAGNDTINAGAGNDQIYGGKGNDTLVGDIGNDTYYFNLGDGVDTIKDSDSKENNDIIQFGEGINSEDILIKRVGNNLEMAIKNTEDKVIISGYYNTTYSGSYRHDTERIEQIKFADGTTWENKEISEFLKIYNGTDGDDSLVTTNDDRKSNENEFFYGGAGNDTISAGVGEDYIYGGDGNDKIYAGAGNDQIYGGKGNDLLEGGIGNDIYYFNLGDGVDTIKDSDGEQNNDIIQFGEGINSEDILIKRVGNNLEMAIKNTEDKVIISGYYNTTYSGSYRHDTERIEQIKFADGTTWENKEISEFLKIYNGTDGDDSLVTTNDDRKSNENEFFYGGAGNDTISAGVGEDYIYGGDGNDKIYAGAGNDQIYGGKGNDLLEGGIGNDIYYFNLGDGVDTIKDSDGNENNDIIQFGEGINSEDILIKRVGNNLEMAIKNTEDKVIISGYYNTTYSGSYRHDTERIEQIKFADGTTWENKEISEFLKIYNGTDGDDSLVTTNDDRKSNENEFFYGGAGNDTISAGVGEDYIYGGDGNDKIYAGAGNDQIYGGTGNDLLEGGIGNDIYYFNLGDGVDTIKDSDGNENNDIIQFGEGINSEDILIKRVGNNLEMAIKNTEDKVIISGYYNTTYSGSYRHDTERIEQIKFADGTTWENKEISEFLKIYNGTDGDDSLVTTNDDRKSNENEFFYGGAGNDTISAGVGEDYIYGGDGNDKIYAGAGNDQIYGGTGNDLLEGGIGNDIYYFNLGDGVDTIKDSDGNENNDIIQFGEGINSEDILIKRVGNNLEMAIKNTEDRVIISGYYNTTYYSGSYRHDTERIEQIKFADGTTWENKEISEFLKIYNGTDGDDSLVTTNDDKKSNENEFFYGGGRNDTISAGVGEDYIYGGDGNDKIYAGAGNDHIHGGKGNDLLEGEIGNDIYYFNLGDGVDTIKDSDGNENNDIIQFGEGINSEDILIKRVGNNLEMAIKNTEDRVIISGYYNTTYYSGSYRHDTERIEQIKFADGTTWEKKEISDLARVYNGTEGNDILTTTSNDKQSDENEIFYGGAGNDTLSGGYGNDTFYGGTGNDIIDGGIGNDVYIFNIGDGSDTIKDYDTTVGNKDVLKVEYNIHDISFLKNNNNMNINLGLSGDEINIDSWYKGTQNQIEEIHTKDGYIINNSNINQLIQAMTTFSENTGMTWNELKKSPTDNMENVLSQFWVKND